MSRAAFAFSLEPEYGPFLFAAIGKESNGMLLSVLSAFARTTIDPWQEAARLAGMSRSSATARLTEFISGLPDRPTDSVPAEAKASELIALLPRAASLATKTPDKASTFWSLTTEPFRWAFVAVALVNLIVFLTLSVPAPKSEGVANLSPRHAAISIRVSP